LSDNKDSIAKAELLADNLRTLAMDYQAVVRSTRRSDAEGKAARNSLDRKFLKLQSREVISRLREDGLAEVADKLDDLFGAAAMIFNLVAVSIGVDEAEVLDIDIDGPYATAIETLGREARN